MIDRRFLKKALRGERVGLIGLIKRWIIQRALKSANWMRLKDLTVKADRMEALATAVLPSLKRDAEIIGPYQLHFRGWQPELRNTCLVGIWVAWPVEDENLPFLYASYPGGKGAYERGDQFDVEPRRNQAPITYKSTKDAKQHASADAYLRLKYLVGEQISKKLETEHERSHIGGVN